MSVFGTVGLGICYVWARHLNHVDTFCDISSLVVHLPERVLFRLNFGLVGSMLAFSSIAINNMAAARVGGVLPKVGAFFQFLSGVGVILVGACGPEEILWVHLTAAFLGFGGSAIAQIVYTIVFFGEDQQTQPQSAQTTLIARCICSTLFLISAILLGVAEANLLPSIIPENPWGHIFEWTLWFTLLAWYFTWRSDLAEFYIADVQAKATRC